MIFATVVTANHFFLDAVGAWVVLAVAYARPMARLVAVATAGARHLSALG